MMSFFGACCGSADRKSKQIELKVEVKQEKKAVIPPSPPPSSSLLPQAVLPTSRSVRSVVTDSYPLELVELNKVFIESLFSYESKTLEQVKSEYPEVAAQLRKISGISNVTDFFNFYRSHWIDYKFTGAATGVMEYLCSLFSDRLATNVTATKNLIKLHLLLAHDPEFDLSKITKVFMHLAYRYPSFQIMLAEIAQGDAFVKLSEDEEKRVCVMIDFSRACQLADRIAKEADKVVTLDSAPAVAARFA